MALTPFLMFQGSAQEALDLYTAVIPRAAVESVVHFPAEQAAAAAAGAGQEPPGPGSAGPLIMMSVLNLDGQRVRVNDSPVRHEFTFTPASSLYFETEDLTEYEAVLAGLSADGGAFLMEDRDDYGFAQRYAWLHDRLGVSWQLALLPADSIAAPAEPVSAADAGGEAAPGARWAPEEQKVDHRHVSVVRTGFERYEVTTPAGARLEFGRGEGLVDPVEMLMSGLAGCMAICIDEPLTRAGEPERFVVTVDAAKLRDSAQATRLDDLAVAFDLQLGEWERRQDPAEFVERLVHAAHERACTVSRTLTQGAAVAASVRVEVAD